MSGPPSSVHSSPTRKKLKTGDRFIPNRTGVDLLAAFNLESIEARPLAVAADTKRQRTEEANRNFSTLLRSELFGDTIPEQTLLERHRNDFYHTTRIKTPPRSTSPASASASATGAAPTTPKSSSRSNLFSYMSPSARSQHHASTRTPTQRSGHPDPNGEVYSLSPVRFDSQRLITSPQKQHRKVAKVPYKVLDAPDLQDDFYLNLVDWGAGNKLAVGLNSCVYLWSAASGKVTKLCDTDTVGGGNTQAAGPVTSVSWIQRGSHVAVGTHKGLVHIWDAETQKLTRTMTGHTSRVGALAWNESILSSGSRDRLIYHRDVRVPEHHIRKLTGHRQEVCGLKWNGEQNQLASGGNDNKLFVWDGLSDKPLYKFSQHTAAVKAIAWNPHQHGILGSGGGTQDRTIKFWNTLTGTQISEIDTGSQVCNLLWSKNSNELVSTHGYSENQVVVWKYPSMTQIASLTGHTYRVLYLSMSPDGTNIVTGAGDETLRFWNVFGKNRFDESRRISILDPTLKIR